jgi:dihydrolipoamide dehydrogenase
VTGDGFVSVNHWLQTSQDNIYAVGDMNGLSVFAHAASAQALSAVNHLSGVQSGYDAW